MASRNAQSHAKRQREFAVRERRELKRAKKAAQRAADGNKSSVDPSAPQTADEHGEATAVDSAEASEESSRPTDSND